MDANTENQRKLHIGKTVDLYYYPQEKFIEVNYKGGVTQSEEFREINESNLKYSSEFQVKKWLIDQIEMSIHPNDQKWFFEDFQPRFNEAIGKGRKSAILPAKNLFSEFSVKQENQKLMEKNDPEIMMVKFFKNREEALEWLLSDNVS